MFNIYHNTPILIGETFRKFPTLTSKQKSTYGIFKCHCGKEFETAVQSIKNKQTLSCGCYQKQQHSIAMTTHGCNSHRLYSVWKNMKARCENKKHKSYKDYGGRGIFVCHRWDDIHNFIEDMFPSFKEGLTLDRIKVDDNYKASNCRWTTSVVQARNTRTLTVSNTSGYRGVSWHKRINKWAVSIAINGNKKHIGYFKIAVDGANAYDLYVTKNNLEHTKNF